MRGISPLRLTFLLICATECLNELLGSTTEQEMTKDGTATSTISSGPNVPKYKRSSSNDESKNDCRKLPALSIQDSELTSIVSNVSLTHEQKLREMLKRGNEKLILDEHNKAAVFVLGNKAFGNTAIMQILNGNLSQLYAARTSKGQLAFIEDLDHIGSSTTNTKTVFPEYVFNPTNNVSFYEFPGFDDHREAEADIVAKYFIRATTKHVKKVKFLFVADADDDDDVKLLVTYASDFLLKMQKFKSSIGLVLANANDFSMTSSEVVERTVRILQQYHNTIESSLAESRSLKSESDILWRKLIFVEGILEQDGSGKYYKIGILPNPQKCDQCSKIPSILEAKAKITELYMHKLSYADSELKNFRFPLKNSTVHKIRHVYVPEITETIENRTRLIVDSSLDLTGSDGYSKGDLARAVYNLQRFYLDLIHYTNSNIHVAKFSENVLSLNKNISGAVPEAYFNNTKWNENLLDFYAPVLHVSKSQYDISASNRYSRLKFRRYVKDLMDHTIEKIKDIVVPEIKMKILNCTHQAVNDVIAAYTKDLEKKLIESDSESNLAIQELDEYYLNLNTSTGTEMMMELFNLLNIQQQSYSYMTEKRFIKSNPEARQALQKLQGDYSKLYKYARPFEEIRAADADNIRRGSILLGYPVPQSYSNIIKEQEVLLDEYVMILGQQDGRPQLDTSLFNLLDGIQQLKTNTWENIKLVSIPVVILQLNDIANLLVNNFTQTNDSNFKQKFGRIETMQEVFKELDYKDKSLQAFNGDATNSFSEKLKKLFLSVNFVIPDTTLNEISKLEDSLAYYVKLVHEPNNISDALRPNVTSLFLKLLQVQNNKKSAAVTYINETSVPQILSQINKTVADLSTSIKDLYMHKFYKNWDRSTMSEKFSVLKTLCERLGTALNTWTGRDEYLIAKSPYKISDALKTIYDILHFDTPTEQFDVLASLETQLDDYGELMESVRRPVQDWLRFPKETIASLEFAKNWYSFLDQTTMEFMRFETQNDSSVEKQKTKTEMNSCESLQQLWNARRDLFDQSVFIQELVCDQQNNTLTFDIQNCTSKLAKSRATLEDTTNLIYVVKHSLLKTTYEWKDDHTKVSVKGSYVIISDVIATITKNLHYSKLSELEIFSSNVVFFDDNIRASGKTITILADRWIVIGSNRTIDLSGSNGLQYRSSKMHNGTLDGENGKDGLAGYPGENGGKFCGEYVTVELGKLKIDVRGGKGGNGQDGGDGHNGRAGRNADRSNFTNLCYTNYTAICTLNAAYNETTFLFKGPFKLDFEKQSQHSLHIMEGGKGQPGGNGGNGGRGGAAGFPGFVEVLPANKSEAKSVSIEWDNSQTSNGTDGEGGKGGKGGKSGLNLAANLTQAIGNGSMWWDIGEYSIPETTRAQDGENGKAGKNTVYKEKRGQHRLPQQPIKPENVLRDSIRSYKKFKRESSKATPASFAQEFLDLEVLFYSNGLTDKTIIKEYQDLLPRINKYMRNQTPIKPADRWILNMLSATILSKLIILLEKQSASTMIVNVADYFKIVKRKYTLKTAQHEFNKIARISAAESQFKSEIESKMRESQLLIESELLPSFDKIGSSFMEIADDAVTEMHQLLERVKNSTEKVKKKESKLFWSSLRKSFFQGLTTIGGIAQFFGPMGQIVSAGVNIASSVNDIYGEHTADSAHPPLSKDFQSFMGKMHENFMTRNTEYIPALLKMTESTIQQYQHRFPELQSLTSGLKEAYENLQNITIRYSNSKQISPHETFTAHQKFDEKLFELLNATYSVKNERGKFDSTLNLRLGRLANAIIVANSNLTKAMEQDKSFDGDLSPEMAELSEIVLKIKMRMQSVYKNFIPTVRFVMVSLLLNAETLSKNSRVALQVRNWKVQNMLQALKLKLHEVVAGISMEQETLHCVEKLQETFTMLVSLYDNIEIYEERKQLASYIAKVNTPGAAAIEGDPELQKLVAGVKFYAKANLFLYNYEIASAAFKQWAFPFASKYLGNETLPNVSLTSVTEERDLNATIDIFVNKFRELSGHMQEYETMVKYGDALLMKSTFSSRFVSTRPFYVWKNKQWHSSIANLLTGKAVILYADICKSNQNYGAVKFKSIELHLKVPNATMQMELDEKLKHYHVEMVHSGTSHYKLLSDVFIINGNKQTVRYSFERRNDSSNSPVTKNVVGDKFITSGDYLLSPYTEWRFKLLDLNENPKGFAYLQRFVAFIDLELQGEGIYINEKLVDKSKLMELNTYIHYQPEIDRCGIKKDT